MLGRKVSKITDVNGYSCVDVLLVLRFSSLVKKISFKVLKVGGRGGEAEMNLIAALEAIKLAF